MLGRIKHFVNQIILWLWGKWKHVRKGKISPDDVLKEHTVRQIGLVFSLLKPMAGRPCARVFKVDHSSDVLRFMLLVCNVDLLDYKIVGGLLRSSVILPNGAGELCLQEKKADKNHQTLAVLKVNVPLLTPPVEEVLFKIRP